MQLANDRYILAILLHDTLSKTILGSIVKQMLEDTKTTLTF